MICLYFCQTLNLEMTNKNEIAKWLIVWSVAPATQYMSNRVFLKRHFVENQNPHPTTQQGDTQGEHIQKDTSESKWIASL